MRKHPHERGEDLLATNDRNPTMETPPRAWGRLVFPLTDFLLYKKHPHERGEDPHTFLLSQGLRETPPRAWGRRRGKTISQWREGNTPTSVGKTRYIPHLRN